jgi:hypothetical protein
MRTLMTRIRIAGTMACLLPVAAHAETFRCGQSLVTSEMTVSELTNKCGAPTSRESKTEDVKVRNQHGLMIKIGETTTETWTYDRGSQGAPMVVTIIDGAIKKIERLRK